MARSEQIRVMISSRCKAEIDFEGKRVLLTDLRERLKKEIEELAFWPNQKKLFDCWINEPSPGSDIRQTWWERSIDETKDADIVIVLYNGQAGGGIKDGPIGICHAELEAVLTDSKKVRIIPLPFADASKDKAQLERDEAFQTFVKTLDIFAPEVKNGEQLIERVRQEITALVVSLVQNASTTPDLSKSNVGTALEWHRMTYAEREKAMRTQLQKALKGVPGTKAGKARFSEGEWVTMWFWIGGKRILCVLHAVPAGLSQPAARELVGQPFLMDHTLHEQLADGDGGPLHFVACYKGATESQALKMLGFPDATVVPGRFGLHLADSVQKIQIVLLKNCQSPTATTHAFSTWHEWLKRSGEEREVVKRALARKRIIDAIAEVNRRM